MGQNSPVGQVKQSADFVAPRVFLNVPTGQSTGFTLPDTQNWPMRQAWQSASCWPPVVVRKVPAGHAVGRTDIWGQ